MSSEETLSKHDIVSIKNVFKLRKALVQALTENAAVAGLIGESYEWLLPEMLNILSNRLSVSPAVMEQTLNSLLSRESGGYPSLADIHKACWIMAANVDTMKMGQALEPFSKVLWAEWVPMMMQDFYKDCTSTAKAGNSYKFLSMAGYSATSEFRRFVPNKGGLRFIHLEMFGLPKSKYYEMKLPHEYVGMYTWVYLDPKCKFGAFERAQCNAAFVDHNRGLLNARREACPYGYNLKCHECLMGYEQCFRATHRKLYVQRACKGCRMGLFQEGDDKEEFCLDCKSDAFLRKKRYAITHRKD